MLIIQPVGGLCNRMRSINSARVLAQKRGEKLTVIWFVNPELGCPFERIFEPTDAFDNMKKLDFEHSERVLWEERQKAREYITNALKR